MQNTLFKNIAIVNENKIIRADLYVKKGRIETIGNNLSPGEKVDEINGDQLHLFPGVIDDHVHFREPGLTQKADIHSESRAAVAGGVTSFMEMPNTIPNVLTTDILQQKYQLAQHKSLANYSFYMGSGNNNIEEILKANKLKKEICGVKIYMGSSTGNMLVDKESTLHKIFRDSELLIATHCEDEQTIRNNYTALKEKKNNLEPSDHPLIRNDEACFKSSAHTIALAKEHGSRLHVVHVTTEKEKELFRNDIPLKEKKITAEVCVHHLHFTSDDYPRLGYLIKCNPAIKEKKNKEALWDGLLDDHFDLIATDHAPHLLSEKQPPYEKASSGLPMVQHSLLLMLFYYTSGKISLEKIAEKMCHSVADCFHIENRGFIREGYFADLVVVDLKGKFIVSPENIYYKCGWSPLEGFEFPARILKTLVNGNCVFDNGLFPGQIMGHRLRFDR